MAIAEAPIAHDETTTRLTVPSLATPSALSEREIAPELPEGKPASFFWTFIDQQNLSWDARAIACTEFKIFFEKKAQEKGYDPDSWGSDIKTPLHILSAVEGLPLQQAWEFARELGGGFNMRGETIK
ncbi:MAG: hypothetical protein HY430_02205 [Candidatus Levybacteria bacterium]|nr:hypothetical protein [Candidatus Levybacteria bacterium]